LVGWGLSNRRNLYFNTRAHMFRYVLRLIYIDPNHAVAISRGNVADNLSKFIFRFNYWCLCSCVLKHNHCISGRLGNQFDHQ